MVDWATAARRRLSKAEEEVRAAERQLRPDDQAARERYRTALGELDRARRFLNRLRADNEAVYEGGGLFG